MKYFYGPNYSNLRAEANGNVIFGHEYDTSIYSFVRQSNGAFTIQSSCYGAYLTAESDGYVRLRPYTGAANQQWYFYNSSYTDKKYVKSAAYNNGYLVPSVTNGNRIGSYLKIGSLPTDLATQYEYSFNYHGIKNALCGKINSNTENEKYFTVKRIVVIQMK